MFILYAVLSMKVVYIIRFSCHEEFEEQGILRLAGVSDLRRLLQVYSRWQVVKQAELLID